MVCHNRCVTALKDVSSQLGPIGASIQTKLAQTTDEGLREVLTQQKQLALELYEKLQVRPVGVPLYYNTT